MKISRSVDLQWVLIAAVVIILSGCHGKSSSDTSTLTSDSTPTSTTTAFLSGTVAAGAPMASATITLKDKTGAIKTVATGTDGKYSIDIPGMKTPILIRVPRLKKLASVLAPEMVASQTTGTEYLYSVATATGIANIHPFTDLIIRNWYKVKGGDVDTDFEGIAALSLPPTDTEIAMVESVVRGILSSWLTQVGLTSASFNLITASFDANSAGFDKVLDNTNVAIDNTGQVTVTSKDPNTGIGGTTISTNIANLATADTTKPTDPSGLVALAAGANNIVLAWNASTDNISVGGYNIYRGGTKVGSSPYPVYSDTGLVSSTSYCYQVEAFDGAGNISANKSGQACATTLAASDTQAPTAPANLTATGGAGSVTLGWTASTDNTAVLGYQVFRGTIKIASVTATSYNDIGLTAGTNYCYTVKAFDAAGNVSAASAQACSTAQAASTAVTTIWKASTNIGMEPTSTYWTSSQTTYLALNLTQTGNSLSGIWSVQDTLGFSTLAELTGSITGNTFTAQYSDAACSRTITLTGTINGSSMTVSETLPAGTCTAGSAGPFTFSQVTPSKFMAGGTYSYAASSGTLTFNWLNTNFPEGTGVFFKIGSDEVHKGITVTSTTMNWGGGTWAWTRSSGTAGDITGTWSLLEPGGDMFLLSLDANGSASFAGNWVGSNTTNAYVDTVHNANGYYIEMDYGDPNHSATSVSVSGPGITGSLSLTYSPNGSQAGLGGWVANRVSLGNSPPTLPLTYTFAIATAYGSRTETATAGCVIVPLPTNLQFGGAANRVFSWTQVPFPNMGYYISLNGPSGYIWDNGNWQTDISSVPYSGPTLTSGTTYNYNVEVHSNGEFNCYSTASGSFVY